MGNLDRQKIVIIFGTALVCAFLMSWLVLAKAQGPKTEKMVKVVAAARDMGAGVRLKATDLKLISIAEKDLPKNTTGDPKLLLDRVLLFPVNVNEPIVSNKLSSLAGAEGLAATIEIGKRAVSVPISDQSGAGGLILPRSHVDVLFTRTGSMNEAVTTVLLQNVRVLSIGRMTEMTAVQGVQGAPGQPAPSTSSTATRAATLLVTPEQAAKLEFARQQGKISLALRNPLDTEVVQDQDQPIVTAEDVGVGIGPRLRRGGPLAGRVPNLRNDEVWRQLTGGAPRLDSPPPPPKPKAEEKKEPPKPRAVVDVYKGDKHIQEIFQ
ncbi:MAG: Flp pilus assembly protein CpaB [Bryobacteraceae bacterium]|nr:Flp pilus assembly protein CpaB [Bryobacteraceae bacterium]MDW8379488.1 Flp pilus assembly protein CpaB [Bryobacterales bacterium]